MTTKALVTVTPTAPLSLPDTLALAEHFVKSGFFKDGRSVSQAVVKIVAGRELGFGPMASMTGIHIIEGKPSTGAHLLAALIKRSERYDYKVIRCDKDACELEFFERKDKGKLESLGKVSMTLAEAKETGLAVKAGGGLKDNWKRTPDDMLFARAISKGYRRYCPDLSCGVTVYTPEDLERDEPELTAVESVTVEAAPSPNGTPEAPATVDPAELVTDAQLQRIDLLATQLQIPHETFFAVLKKDYGVDRAEDLTPVQATEVETRLEIKFRGKVAAGARAAVG
jgi:hypothetical protein